MLLIRNKCQTKWYWESGGLFWGAESHVINKVDQVVLQDSGLS